MNSIEAFSPLGVLDITPDGVEPSCEPAIGPGKENDGEWEREEEIAGTSEEEIRRQLEKEELAVPVEIPTKDKSQRREKTSPGTFAPNLRINSSARSPGEKLPPIPAHEDIADLLEHDATKNALRRLQSTRSVLGKQLS